MTRAMVAITLVFVAGTAAFAASLVHLIAFHKFNGLDVVFMSSAGLLVAASALAAVRRRPAMGPASITDAYAMGCGSKRVEH
ncbi:hypothetical protein [Nonomuraea sediminis]|uniref:hypothetical protein n=1 Tax=Nonomuraea sediminis TaxID=2835864 RepID=UPI001BDCBCA4|nr:hypothetical protein [Nonomuraea sediminis]